MSESDPKDTLLLEYGLNLIQYRLLALLAEAGPITWPDKRLIAVTRSPGPSLRKLIALRLLSGPAPEQIIRGYPLALTEQGAAVLDKVRRGQHRVSWLSEHKWAALARLADGPLPGDAHEGYKLVTLRSLVENGYAAFDGVEYTLTDLGREAWAEALADNRRMCRLCQSGLRAYAAEVEVAGQPCFVAGSLEHYHPRRNQPATIPVTCRNFSHINGAAIR